MIYKQLKKNKTNFIPVDSEHFSIWCLTNKKYGNIDEIYLTASGGPFLNKKRQNLKNINQFALSILDGIWVKISITSATMVNKVFEVRGQIKYLMLVLIK